MDWRMLLISVVMLVAGGALAWRFRGSKFQTDAGPGCAMAVALLLLLTGALMLLITFVFRV
jgi:hypothetical protein